MFNIFLLSCGAVVIVFMLRKMTLSKSILSVFSGIAALLASDLLLSFFGNSIPLNPFTVIISGFGGIPSVILMTILRCFI